MGGVGGQAVFNIDNIIWVEGVYNRYRKNIENMNPI